MATVKNFTNFIRNNTNNFSNSKLSMKKIGNNLKFLRRHKKITQEQLATDLSIKRSRIGAYEEGRADPKMDALQIMASYFKVEIQDIINETINEKWLKGREFKEKKAATTNLNDTVRVLAITVDKENNENIEAVGLKASAGYLNGFADATFVEDLPKFSLPIFKNGTFRAFEIKGDSMLPIESGSYIIAEYISNWKDIKSNETYIIVSKDDGIVYKRIQNNLIKSGTITLQSDNKTYDDYSMPHGSILEVWKAKAFLSTAMPDAPKLGDEKNIDTIIHDLQRTIDYLKK